ncbi:MAG: hypothetical protein H6726_16870 [Sandaracinaceae bacterium]|nr:hypothetical protein [Sandaracinaceae bacterium]
MLRAQLTERFGELDATDVETIEAATAPALEQMLIRVLTATSPDDVLGAP